MKKLFMAVCLILVMVISVNAADLRWDASVGQVDGYNIQIVGGAEPIEANVGNVTEVLDIFNYFGLDYATIYTFTATAWNINGESLPSNSAVWTSPDGYTPLPPWVIPVRDREVPPVVINFVFEE